MVISGKCPKCGAELAAGGAACPRCLIGLALGPNAASLTKSERPTESLHFEDDLRIPGHLLLCRLGEGGMGQVFLAEDTGLQRRVAIKVMAERLLGSGDAADRFLREARAMARVDHPNVLRLHSYGKVGARSYIVMEYVEGKSLAQKLGNDGLLHADTALRYLRQGVAALEAAWQHGIIHRDIKPSNLLITSTDQVRVADFGLAKAVELDDDVSITATGQVLGTPLYMSPEQARADAIDFRTDFYALGIVMFEMLTGRPPYLGTVPARIIDQHLHAPFPSVREIRAEVPASVEQLCEWMTRKDPGNRPESHPALLEAMDGLLDAGLAEASMSAISATDLHYTADESMGTPAASTKPGSDSLGRN